MRLNFFQDLFSEVVIDGMTYLDIAARRFKVNPKYVNDVTYYQKARVSEHDRIDVIAHRALGDSSLWWVIAVMNDIFDPFYDLPMEDNMIADTARMNVEQEFGVLQANWNSAHNDRYDEIVTELESEREIISEIKVPRALFVPEIINDLRSQIRRRT